MLLGGVSGGMGVKSGGSCRIAGTVACVEKIAVEDGCVSRACEAVVETTSADEFRFRWLSRRQ